MYAELSHNKILMDTMSDAFVNSIEAVLIPKLDKLYGEAVSEVIMYEDYLSDDLRLEGRWYYPLTLVSDHGSFTQWVSWSLEPKRAFRDGIPYSYVGAEPLEFEICVNAPEEFASVLSGRAISYDKSALPIKVHAATADPTLLSGKYSQTFVDEMARQLTDRIASATATEGYDKTTIELQMVFASGTYMEHTSENITYRRLLMTERGCRARDFWVKWTRLDGAVAYSASDNVNADNILFEIGEDVPRKIREKEYRFLCSTNPDKYEAAMSKRAATEWRELIKRAVKRGDLLRVVKDVELADTSDDEVSDRLRELLGDYATPAAEPMVAEQSDFDSRLAEMAMAALGITADAGEANAEGFAAEEYALATEYSEEDEEILDEQAMLDMAEELDEEAAIADFIYSAAFGSEERSDAEEVEEYTEENIGEDIEEYIGEPAIATPEDKPAALDEDRIRAEIEAKLRAEYEAEAKARAEEEAARLRLEHQRLLAENERLLAAARLAEEQRRREDEEREAELAKKMAEEERRRKEEEELRARIEQQARRDAEERARLAEAARLAVEEQRRIEAERKEREAREREEAILRERERLAREEEARRIEQLRREEERRRIAAERAAAIPSVDYVTKHARLIFGRAIDAGVISKIKEIVEQTLIREHKENIHIHIKAYPVDSYTINLDIMKIPSTEKDLLVSIVKAIGNGRIGITKIIVE